MENRIQESAQDRYGPGSYRTTARIVGLLFVAGMVVGIGGSVLVLSILGAPDPLSNVSANSLLLAVAAFLWLMTVVGDAAHGVLMFPVLKQHNERIAIGYLTARIVDAVFIAVMVLFILLQIPLASEYLKAGASDTSYLQGLSTTFVQVNLYAYDIAMFTLGVAGLLLCYTFHRAGLVPRLVAVWGLAGYAVILFGSVLQLLGFNLHSIHAIPGGLWELFIGVWLFVKGFSASPVPSEPTTSSTTPSMTTSTVGSATA
jgi:hypothetical protein